ncbi:MAG: DUF5719 family protein [Actinomycetota bacterium]|jgi:hypothetical protein|nr:DUF5719 family protein [Actinomycetota bacterium]
MTGGGVVPASAARRRRWSLAVLIGMGLLLSSGIVVDLLEASPSAPATESIVQDLADAGRWYCPATVGRRETAVLEVATVGDRAAEVTVDRYAGGTARTNRARTMPPGAVARIKLGGNRPSVVRWEGGPVAVTWRSTDRTETIAAPCEPAPGRRWHAAGFDTTLGSTSTLHLFNPFGEDATVSLIFATPDGPVRLVATDNLVVPAGTSRQLDLGRFQPEIADLGVTAEVASGRIVAQGEVDIGPPGKSRGVSGRALLRAAGQARRSWTFAWACSGESSESWLQVLNAGGREAAVEVRVSDPVNDASSVLGEVSVPAGGTTRIELAEASRRREFGVTVTGVNDEAIVVSRLTAIARAGGRDGIAASLGAVGPATEWAVVGGGGPDQRDMLSIYNAGSRQARVDVVAGAGPPEWSGITVEPNARAEVMLRDAGAAQLTTPLRIHADRPVVTELRSAAKGDELHLWSAVGVPAASWRGQRTRPPVHLEPGLASRDPASLRAETTEGDGAPVPPGVAPPTDPGGSAHGDVRTS